jgi:hypothetical protein
MRYRVERRQGRRLWDVFDIRYGNTLVATFPSRKSAFNWAAEHQEAMPPGFIRRVGHLDLLQGGLTDDKAKAV